MPSSSGAAPAEPVVLSSTVARRAPGAAGAAGESFRGFGTDMLRETYRAGENLAISPYSLFTVLAMARAGALGSTAEQLDAVLRAAGTDAQGAAVSAVDSAVATALKGSRPNGSALVVETANQTWIQQGLDVRQAYVDALARQFGVSAVTAAFVDDPDGMRTAINGWVADRTNDLITELFPERSITDLTRLVLVNALYLKASWRNPFRLIEQPVDFTRLDGTTVPTTLMTAGEPVRAVQGRNWIAAQVGYVGRGLAMTVLLPDAGEFDAVLAVLDDQVMAQAAEVGGRYTFRMPRFEIRSTPDVLKAVQQLGVTDLFSASAADLSGIAGQPGDLYAAAFVHQAVVLVDENGTEAAAATGMGMAATGAPAETTGNIVVDRPFLFWISDDVTGAPLFLGAVCDPEARS